MSEQAVSLKRQVTVKTRITDGFREKANTELGKEVALIDQQLHQLDAAYQNSIQQLEQLAQQGQDVSGGKEQLDRDAKQKRLQMMTLKDEVQKQLGNLDSKQNGDLVTTGLLESFVELKIGDPIYERIRNTVIIVEDGNITEITSEA